MIKYQNLKTKEKKKKNIHVHDWILISAYKLVPCMFAFVSALKFLEANIALTMELFEMID